MALENFFRDEYGSLRVGRAISSVVLAAYLFSSAVGDHINKICDQLTYSQEYKVEHKGKELKFRTTSQGLEYITTSSKLIPEYEWSQAVLDADKDANLRLDTEETKQLYQNAKKKQEKHKPYKKLPITS